jgi:hypothetical protein
MSSRGQNESSLEKQLSLSLQHLQRAQMTQDSLQNLFDSLAIAIENQKTEKSVTEKQLAQWYEQLKEISGSLEKQKKEVNDISLENSILRRQLEKIYSQKIDSLQQVYDKVKKPEQRKVIEKNLNSYMEKRIAVLPVFKTFTFDPAKVLEIDPRQAKDSLEYMVFTSYLQNAGKEIEDVLGSVKKSRSELQDMAYLQERSSRFLEEIDNSPVFSFPTYSGSERTYNTGTFASNDELSKMPAIQSQVRSLFDVLDQFNHSKTDKYPSAFVTPLDSQKIYSSLDDYIHLLRETEKLLENYLKIVNTKISAAK